MMVFLFSTAMAAGWGGLRDTAGTVDQGDVVVRLPVGTSAVGLTDHTELQVQPFDLYIWGPRVGIEQVVVDDGPWTLSVRPSVATSGGIWSTRAEALVAWTGDHHRFGGTVAGDGRWMRQTILGADKTHAWSLLRVDVPLVATWDWMPGGPEGDGMLRSRVRAVLYDEGDTLDFYTVTESWTHRLGKRDRFFLETGVSMLVGRPSEHVFLGDYAYFLVMPYPRIDVWWQF